MPRRRWTSECVLALALRLHNSRLRVQVYIETLAQWNSSAFYVHPLCARLVSVLLELCLSWQRREISTKVVLFKVRVLASMQVEAEFSDGLWCS